MNIHLRRGCVTLFIVLFSAAVLPAADTPPPAPPAKSPQPEQAPPATPPAPAAAAPVPRNTGGPGDYGLREKLMSSIGRDVELAKSGLAVVLVNGGVVFSGDVPNWTVRRRALLLASSMRGVINVTDQMNIQRGGVKDAEILKAVAGLLDPAKETLGLKDLKVEVEDGVVTMSGAASTFQTRVRAEEIAGTVLGAIRIVNKLRAADAPAGTDDTTVRRAIASYLKDFRQYPYAGEIEVQVRGGRAVLTGQVPLYLARQQAGTMVGLVGGVREVENRIDIDPSLQMQAVTVKELP
jgi:osmotically-inducible protein OsmY